MGASARHPVRLAVAAPRSTPASSNETSRSARFFIRGTSWARDESTVLGVDEDGIAIPMICRRVVGAAGYGQFELSFLRPNLLATGTVSYRISYAAQSGRTGRPRACRPSLTADRRDISAADDAAN
jgi:hypothetical protein